MREALQLCAAIAIFVLGWVGIDKIGAAPSVPKFVAPLLHILLIVASIAWLYVTYLQ